MSEIKPDNKIIVDMKKRVNAYNSLIPSYLRGINNILAAKEQVKTVSWEEEGEMVRNL